MEAALLGLLPDEHLLGGPVGHGPAGPRIRVGGHRHPPGTIVVLRDPEHSPVAELEVETSSPTGVRGILRGLRRRESGLRADLALTLDDRGTADVVVVLARPPVHEDGARIGGVIAAADPLIVVPDDPTSPVPAEILLAAAHAWLEDIGAPPRARVRTAPLAGRSSADDAELRSRLVDWFGASGVVLAADDGSPGGDVWAGAAEALDAGTVRPVGLDPGVERALLRWRPPRSLRGLCVMFTGLSGSGKSTVARDLADWLTARTSRTVTVLDGDRVRRLLSSGLGFDREGREQNIRRIGFVAAEVVRHGGVAICSPIAPFAQTRAEVREMVEQVGDLVLVHVDTPLSECERRDLKGLYARARRGELADFTGISSPYEVPGDADLRLDTSALDRAASLRAVLDVLVTGGWVRENR